MGNADFCSRFPLKQSVPAELDQDFVRSINFSKDFPLDFVLVAKATTDDVYLQQILSYLRDGWPEKVDKRFMDVFANQNDLEEVEGCLLYQDRVVIPRGMQSGILKLLHANHAGIVKMKQLARRQVYWFGINKDIEKYVSTCDICGSMAVVPKVQTTSNWTPTTRPFSRIHIDFFYFSRHTFLLIVDSHTKWLEVEWMKQGTDCAKVLKKLVAYFARFGLPDVLVSDNGPPFNSSYFVSFLERQGIKVMKSPPYNPQSNGQAERLVRTTKDVLKKFLLDPELDNIDLEDQINLFLINFRNNTSTSSGQFPSEKVFSYKPKTMLDLLNPKNHYKNHLVSKQTPCDEVQVPEISNKTSNDGLDELIAGDTIWYKNHDVKLPNKWILATYLKKFSKNIFQIQIGNAVLIAQRGQLKPRRERRHEHPNLMMPLATPVTNAAEDYMDVEMGEDTELMRGTGCGEGPFRGFLEPVQTKSRRRKRDAAVAELPAICLRRSKRQRNPKMNDEFVYN